MLTEQYNAFMKGARPVVTVPERHFAKRIKSVRCVNPKQKIHYHYERIHELTFDDETKIEQHEDHWCRPGEQMKEGNWVVVAGSNLTPMFLTPDEFAARYRFND